MSVKLVPRTELLEWLETVTNEQVWPSQLHCDCYAKLSRGRVLELEEWTKISELYHERNRGNVESLPRVETGGETISDTENGKPDVGAILGAYRLQTDSGFVVFIATQGLRGPDLKIGVGLGLPGDGDLQRVLEHGKIVNIDNILELCKWKEETT